jgi:hypothetical protein
MRISDATEVPALSINDLIGIEAGILPPEYAAPNGSLHICPDGVYQMVLGGWQGGYPLGASYVRVIPGATLADIKQGELVFDSLNDTIVLRVGDTLKKFIPSFNTTYPGYFKFYQPIHSFNLGVL